MRARSDAGFNAFGEPQHEPGQLIERPCAVRVSPSLSR